MAVINAHYMEQTKAWHCNECHGIVLHNIWKFCPHCGELLYAR